jgi:hypothetical protein
VLEVRVRAGIRAKGRNQSEDKKRGGSPTFLPKVVQC